MSSSVFFRFKSQKEPTRVPFDGTGISVFELKREIIALSRLGDGTDFELVITSEDSNEEYDDDTSIIPRSTTVIAKRLPAVKAGRGGAARYVSGKMPQNARSTHRQEHLAGPQSSSTPSNSSAPVNGAQTEEERVAAVLKMGAESWAQDQQAMANATPVHRGGPSKGKAANLPDHPPPAGYICYRCGDKGHWIQACPTNDDPTFDGRPRVKRTTGIPRSFLKTVEKPISQANDGTVDETQQPSGVMVNAEGEWVVAEPDKATWDRYQAKAKVSAAAEHAATEGSKELQDKGLECPIDKRLFVNPVKTPCCQKTFCHDCITNALLENDLRCPECSTEGVSFDNLTPDSEMVEKIKSHQKEQAAKQAETKKTEEKIKEEETSTGNTSKVTENTSPQKTPSPDSSSKKRPAETDLQNDHKPAPPTTASKGSPSPKKIVSPTPNKANTVNQQSPFPTPDMMQNQFNPMAFPNMPGINGMNGMNGMGAMMGMAPNMGDMNAMAMNFGMPNPMLMTGNPFMNNDWSNGWAGVMNSQGMGNGMSGNMMPNFGQQQNMFNPMTNSHNGNGMQGNGMGPMHQAPSFFANQQRNSFGNASANDDDSPYFRKPVNPHRHQARRNFNRPADYKPL